MDLLSSNAQEDLKDALDSLLPDYFFLDGILFWLLALAWFPCIRKPRPRSIPILSLSNIMHTPFEWQYITNLRLGRINNEKCLELLQMLYNGHFLRLIANFFHSPTGMVGNSLTKKITNKIANSSATSSLESGETIGLYLFGQTCHVHTPALCLSLNLHLINSLLAYESCRSRVTNLIPRW